LHLGFCACFAQSYAR